MSGAKPSARAETGLKPAKCGPTAGSLKRAVRAMVDILAEEMSSPMALDLD